MIVETCAILFLLFICFLVVEGWIKPRKGGTFINFAKKEMKIKEHPVVYASVCFHALLVIVVCLSIAFSIYHCGNGLPVMWILTLILILLSFLALCALAATLLLLQRVMLRKNPQRQRDFLALILSLSVTVFLGYHVVGALIHFWQPRQHSVPDKPDSIQTCDTSCPQLSKSWPRRSICLAAMGSDAFLVRSVHSPVLSDRL